MVVIQTTKRPRILRQDHSRSELQGTLCESKVVPVPGDRTFHDEKLTTYESRPSTVPERGPKIPRHDIAKMSLKGL